MNDTCKEQIGNWDYVTFRADTKIPYGLLLTDSNSQFMRIQGPFCDLGLHPPCLRLSEHSDRLINVERFVPPEDIYHENNGHISKHDNFEMGDWKVFDVPCNALHHEP